MEIIAEYSFNKGEEFLREQHKQELEEVKEIISLVAGSRLKTKISKEKTMLGKALYSPKALNREFRSLFEDRNRCKD